MSVNKWNIEERGLKRKVDNLKKRLCVIKKEENKFD